jgi:hypothetical protein
MVPCSGDRQRHCKESEEGKSAHGNYLPKRHKREPAKAAKNKFTT